MLQPYEIDALLLSLRVALTATIAGLPLAIALAYWLARTQSRFKLLVDTLIQIPLIVPPVVVGFLLLVTFSAEYQFGAWLQALGLNPAFTWIAAAIASGVMALPLMVRAVRQAFETEPAALRDAAKTLGVEGFALFRRLSLPLAFPGIASAAVLGFARALGEFGATITFAANIPGLTQTLPLAIFSASQVPGGEFAALRLAILSLVPAVGSLLVSEWMHRRHLRRIGRINA
ncbi:MAG: molybdate ABC transporter permease subunit [Kordiimonadaceae bacterium]|nr:molybdate ABC transporter permease subunit [Kordiimonadaceae bacterium]MBO6570558.1 molybdate ABC transporter permease subunit [Kordiimonadaceae bacterium]MBO6966322.1 molybdate ABC transporter permease subunit [Kordiimonadaceae bacterium]